MEQALNLIEIISGAVVLIFACTLVWEIKSKGSMSCKVTQIVLTTVLFALQIPTLVLRILLNQPYVIIICSLCIWALYIALNSFLIGLMSGKKLASTVVVPKIIIDILEPNQENSEGTSNNQ